MEQPASTWNEGHLNHTQTVMKRIWISL
jgi:hypothetical protein